MCLLEEGEVVSDAPGLAVLLDQVNLLEEGLLLLAQRPVRVLHLAPLHVLPHAQQFLLEVG